MFDKCYVKMIHFIIVENEFHMEYLKLWAFTIIYTHSSSNSLLCHTLFMHIKACQNSFIIRHSNPLKSQNK